VTVEQLNSEQLNSEQRTAEQRTAEQRTANSKQQTAYHREEQRTAEGADAHITLRCSMPPTDFFVGDS
jgi:hypothetical protein